MSIPKFTSEGIGARALRKEDARLLRGRGSFVGDISLPGLRDVAFLRSPVAHARLGAVRKPAGFETSVFLRGDLRDVRDVALRRGAGGDVYRPYTRRGRGHC